MGIILQLYFPSLSELEISSNPLRSSGLNSLCAGIRQHHDLQTLTLRKCDIDYDGFVVLASTLQLLPNITKLDVSGNMRLSSSRLDEGMVTKQSVVHSS